jgi:hypothetical protein
MATILEAVMQCYKIRVKESPPLVGFSADGKPKAVFPGDYQVHVFHRPVGPGTGATLRFVGADQRGGDIHVTESTLKDIRDWPRLSPRAPIEILGEAD